MAKRVRHRVRDGDELAVERADRAGVRRRARGSARCARASPPPRCGCGPGRATAASRRSGTTTSRSRKASPPAWSSWAWVRKRRFDAVGVLAQIREVGQDEVDAGHVGLGEHDPAVDEQDAVVDLEAEAVAPDLAEPAEEDDLDRRATHHAQATGALNMNSSIMGFIAMSTSSMRTPSGSRWYANCTRAPSSSRPHSCSGHRSSV